MEEEIEVLAGSTIEDVVKLLEEAREEGRRVFVRFNGHTLHSDDVTMDSAYKEITGRTKAEYDAELQKFLDEKQTLREEAEARDKERSKIVEANREEKPISINELIVVNGLKYIAENPDIDQDELVNGLLKLGCNFDLDDINKRFNCDIPIFDGMKIGDLAAGATVIVNVRDSERGRAFCKERFLDADNDTSVYHFIRVVTGDINYTKDSIEPSDSNQPRRK